MEVRLLVAHSAAETKQIRLGAETLIGRGPECKLRISSGQVSRRHCLIKVAETSVSVRDLGSANGTRLNGQTILTETDVPILPGSTLVVGPLKFVVQFAAPRTTDDEDTEWLSGMAAVAKSTAHDNQAKATAAVTDEEETKDYPPSQQRHRGAPPQVAVARDGLPITAGSPVASNAPIGSDVPGETIFDGSMEERADLHPGKVKPGARPQSEEASETHLLFEEDDLQRLVSEVEASVSANSPVGNPNAAALSGKIDDDGAADAADEKQSMVSGFLGFLRRKPKSEISGLEKSEPGKSEPGRSQPGKSVAANPPDDDDDQLRKFLNEV